MRESLTRWPAVRVLALLAWALPAAAFAQTDPAPYCEALSGFGCGSGNVTNVAIAGTTLNNTSGCNLAPQGWPYTNYAPIGSATATLARGDTYQLSITTSGNNNKSFWADWNHDNQFAASEWVNVARTSVTNQPDVVSFTVPNNAVLGPTRIRIRSRVSGFDNGAPDACLEFFSGEAEDYTLEVTLGGAPNPAPDWTWQRPSGAAADDNAAHTATDGRGRVYAVGRFAGAASFGSLSLNSGNVANADVFLVRYDAAGTAQWAQRAGGSEADEAQRVALDAAGNVYVTGRFRTTATFGTGSGAQTVTSTGESDVFLAKYSAAGVIQWVKQGGSAANDQANGLCLDAAGNVYVVGAFRGSGTFGSTTLTGTPTRDALFLVKYDGAGNVLWAKSATSSTEIRGASVAPHPAGGVYLAGSFSTAATLGTTALTGPGTRSLLLAHYDAAGALAWARALSTATPAGEIAATGIASRPSMGTPGTDAYVAGFLKGSAALTPTQNVTSVSATASDALVLKISAAGMPVWGRVGGGSGADAAQDIALDGTGKSYITGYYTGQGTFDGIIVPGTQSQLFVANYAADGTIGWVAAAGGTLNEAGAGLSADSVGRVFVAGAFAGQASFGAAGTASSNGGLDAVVAALSARCPLAQDLTVTATNPCAGQVLQLAITEPQPTGVTYLWSGPNNFTSTAAAPAIVGVTTAANGKYYVTISAPIFGCSRLDSVAVVVLPSGPTPTATGAARCGAGPVTLAALGGGPGSRFVWYDVPTGGAPLAVQTQQQFTTPVLSTTTTYYVAVRNSNGCEGNRAAAVATVSPGPAPTLTLAGGQTTLCPGSSAVFTAGGGGTGAGYQFLLNNTPIPGATGTTYTATQAGTYAVTATVGSCAGQSVSIPITVANLLAAPLVTPRSRCGPGVVALSASVAGAPVGTIYHWYTQATGGIPIAGATGSSFLTPSITATTTYYVAGATGPCDGPRTPVTATINPAPNPVLTPVGSPVICAAGGSVTLNVTGVTGPAAYQFIFNGAALPGATTASYVATQAGDYSVQVVAGGCAGFTPVVAVTVSTTQPSAAFTYSAPSFCQSAPNPVPTITGNAGGTFTATPAGLLLNATTGSLNLAASAPGTYTITYAISGGCAASATRTVTVTAAPVATFTYPTTGTQCAGTVGTVIPILGAGAVAGTFAATPAGLTLNATTGVINLATSAAGTYTITNALPTGGTCPPASANASLTIAPRPTAVLTPSGATTLCQGQPLTLTASGAGTGGSYQFLLNGTAIPGATSATYAVVLSGSYTVSATTAAGCSAASTAVAVVVNPAQSAAFAYSGGTFCLSGTNPTATITGTPGGTFTATPAGLSLNANTGVIDLAGSTAGTYTVTYTTAGPCAATQTASLALTAPQVANFTYPTAGVCAGAVATLAPVLGMGAVAGTFSSTAGLTVDPATGVVNAATSTPGTYVVTNTLPASGACAAATATATLVLEALPTAALTAGGAATFCAGDSVQFTATGGGAYQFLLNGTAIPGATGATYAATQAGAYSVLVTNAAGCSATSAAVAVTVNALPATPLVTQQAVGAGLVALTAAGIGSGAQVQWYLNGLALAGATDPTYVVSNSGQNGSYTVVVTSAAGCASAPSAGSSVSVTARSGALAGGALTVLPNPTADGQVEVRVTVSGGGLAGRVLVYDATGRQVATAAVGSGSGSAPGAVVSLDLSALPTGIYVVRYVGAQGTLTRRIVRQ